MNRLQIVKEVFLTTFLEVLSERKEEGHGTYTTIHFIQLKKINVFGIFTGPTVRDNTVRDHLPQLV